MKQILHCCGCGQYVTPRLTDGKEIYPHRDDLHSLPFWKCDTCGNFVGCHHKTKDRTRPLGSIPTPEIRDVRKKIHAVLDPLWKIRGIPRQQIYGRISKAIGKEYHTAEINDAAQANMVLTVLYDIQKGGAE